MNKGWDSVVKAMESSVRSRYISAYRDAAEREEVAPVLSSYRAKYIPSATPSKNEAAFVQPIKCEYCGQDDWVTRRDETWCRGCGADYAPQLEAAQKREYNEKYRALLYQTEALLELNYLPRDKKSGWAWVEKMGKAFGL